MCWSLASSRGGMGWRKPIGVSNARSTNVFVESGVSRGYLGICSETPTEAFQRRLLMLRGAFQGGPSGQRLATRRADSWDGGKEFGSLGKLPWDCSRAVRMRCFLASRTAFRGIWRRIREIGNARSARASGRSSGRIRSEEPMTMARSDGVLLFADVGRAKSYWRDRRVRR